MSNIPKTIHYCWFGHQKMPVNLKEYVNNWSNILSDYQIVEWNESNFDISAIPFTSEAYDAGVWAFVSDYVRMYALYNYGGIYLDTDIELIKNFDHLLANDAFIGFESRYSLGSAVIGSTKNNAWVKDVLDIYQEKHFINPDGTLDKTANTIHFTDITSRLYDVKMNNKLQHLNNLTVYPRCYFYPEHVVTRKTSITSDTVAIHHWNSSWHDKEETKLRTKIRCSLYDIFGETITEECVKKYWALTKK